MAPDGSKYCRLRRNGRKQAAFSTAVLELYDETPYALRTRHRFVLKRRLHQGSIERETRLPGSLSTEWWAPMAAYYYEANGARSEKNVNPLCNSRRAVEFSD